MTCLPFSSCGFLSGRPFRNCAPAGISMERQNQKAADRNVRPTQTHASSGNNFLRLSSCPRICSHANFRFVGSSSHQTPRKARRSCEPSPGRESHVKNGRRCDCVRRNCSCIIRSSVVGSNNFSSNHQTHRHIQRNQRQRHVLCDDPGRRRQSLRHNHLWRGE